MSKISRILLVALCVLLLIWGASLVRCEILTILHYDEFSDAWRDNAMISEIEYFKVINYSGKTAQVYYVEKQMRCGHILTFEKKNAAWVEIQWDVIWSGTGGSASGVIYPYIWHFIYGGL